MKENDKSRHDHRGHDLPTAPELELSERLSTSCSIAVWTVIPRSSTSELHLPVGSVVTFTLLFARRL